MLVCFSEWNTLSLHPVILQSYHCSEGEHTRVNPSILVITKSWWNSFAENNPLIRTMSKLTTHPYNFMREIAMIYFTAVYGLFPTIWNANFHTNKVRLRKGLWGKIVLWNIITATQVLPLHFAKKRTKDNEKRWGFFLFTCSSKFILLFTNLAKYTL